MIILSNEVMNVMRDAGFTVASVPGSVALNEPPGTVRYRVSRPGWATFDCYAALTGGMAPGAPLNSIENNAQDTHVSGYLTNFEPGVEVTHGPNAFSVVSRWSRSQPLSTTFWHTMVPQFKMRTAQRVLDGNGEVVPGATLLVTLRTFLSTPGIGHAVLLVVGRAVYLGPSGEAQVLRGQFLTNGLSARTFGAISQVDGGRGYPLEFERLKDGSGGSVVPGPLWIGWNGEPVGLPQQLLVVAHADVANETQNGLTMRAGTREHLLTRVNVPHLPDGLKVFLGYGG